MKKIDSIYLEITNQCNFHCSFCPSHNRPRRFLTQKEFSTILSKIEGAATNLYFHVMGEPFLHPLLPAFIREAGERGFTVTITTNGSLLYQRYNELSDLENFARLNISLQSVESLEKSQRDTFILDIIDASEKMYSLAKKMRKDFLLSYRVWTKEKNEITTVIFNVLETAYMLEQGSLEKKLHAKNSVLLHDRVAIHTAETFSWPSTELKGENPNLKSRAFCLALRSQAGILCDGTVIPCCLDSQGALSLGNILTDSWEEILNSPRAQRLYKGFSDGLAIEDLCKTCSYRLRFDR